MKRCIFLTTLIFVTFIYGTAFGYSWYQEGKLTIENDSIYLHNPHESPKNSHSGVFRLSDLNNVTTEFRKCIEDGKYSGIVGIQSSDSRYDQKKGLSILSIDKKSTCKRIEKYDINIETVVGKLKKDKSGDIVMTEDKTGNLYEIYAVQLEYAPKEFLECIDGGKYKGKLEITAQIGSGTRTSVIFRLNSLATCKRK
jgi:hypothetical protein